LSEVSFDDKNDKNTVVAKDDRMSSLSNDIHLIEHMKIDEESKKVLKKERIKLYQSSIESTYINNQIKTSISENTMAIHKIISQLSDAENINANNFAKYHAITDLISRFFLYNSEIIDTHSSVQCHERCNSTYEKLVHLEDKVRDVDKGEGLSYSAVFALLNEITKMLAIYNIIIRNKNLMSLVFSEDSLGEMNIKQIEQEVS